VAVAAPLEKAAAAAAAAAEDSAVGVGVEFAAERIAAAALGSGPAAEREFQMPCLAFPRSKMQSWL